MLVLRIVDLERKNKLNFEMDALIKISLTIKAVLEISLVSILNICQCSGLSAYRITGPLTEGAQRYNLMGSLKEILYSVSQTRGKSLRSVHYRYYYIHCKVQRVIVRLVVFEARVPKVLIFKWLTKFLLLILLFCCNFTMLNARKLKY